MINFILGLVRKHKSFIAYGVFGVFTTIVNIVTYNICYNSVGMSNTLSNIVAWILAVVFAKPIASLLIETPIGTFIQQHLSDAFLAKGGI